MRKTFARKINNNRTLKRMNMTPSSSRIFNPLLNAGPTTFKSDFSGFTEAPILTLTPQQQYNNVIYESIKINNYEVKDDPKSLIFGSLSKPLQFNDSVSLD